MLATYGFPACIACRYTALRALAALADHQYCRSNPLVVLPAFEYEGDQGESQKHVILTPVPVDALELAPVHLS